jgi:hypothetical protein
VINVESSLKQVKLFSVFAVYIADRSGHTVILLSGGQSENAAIVERYFIAAVLRYVQDDVMRCSVTLSGRN